MIYSSNDLYVAFSYDDFEINKVFSTLEEAENEAKVLNDAYSKTVFAVKLAKKGFINLPYRAIKLYEAIDQIKDYIKSDYNNNDI